MRRAAIPQPCNQKTILWDGPFFHFGHSYFIKCVLTYSRDSGAIERHCMLYLIKIKPMNFKLGSYHKAVVFRVGRERHSQPHLVLSLWYVGQRYPSLRENEYLWGDLRCTDSYIHKYMRYPSETKQEFHHLVLWFVIAVSAAKAASTSSDLNTNLTKFHVPH